MPITENRFFPSRGTTSVAAIDPAGRTTHPNSILAICCMSVPIRGMDVTIVNGVLPAIQEELHVRLAGLQWILDAYTLVVASFLMLAGSMSDCFRRRGVFQIGLGVFTIGSPLCSGALTIENLSLWSSTLKNQEAETPAYLLMPRAGSAENDIKPRHPSLSVVGGFCCSLANFSIDRFPRSPNDLSLLICSAQRHFAVFKFTLDFKQYASIRHPGLMPDIPARVVYGEALTLMFVRSEILFAENAAIQDGVNPGVGNLGRAAHVKHVPITDPEIKLVLGGRSTRRRRLVCGEKSTTAKHSEAGARDNREKNTRSQATNECPHFEVIPFRASSEPTYGCARCMIATAPAWTHVHISSGEP